jgi:hypothetical protein
MSRATVARGRLGIASRHFPDQIEVRRRELAEAKLADYIEKITPELHYEQRTKLAELLTGDGAR